MMKKVVRGTRLTGMQVVIVGTATSRFLLARPATTAHHGRTTAPRQSRLRRPEKKHLTDLRVHTEQSKVSLLWQLSGTYDLRTS